MGGGHPIAALVARQEVVAQFGANCRYFNTYGGNPVSIAAASAVLEIIQRDRLAQKANVVGDYLRDRLRGLATQHEIIGDIRGAGLFTGLELVVNRKTQLPAPDKCLNIVNELKERGVLVGACGAQANVLKIRPPLVFDTSHADALVGYLDEVLRVRETL